MKSALASAVAMVVLATGVPALNVNQTALPPWLCELFPMFCDRR